MKSEDEENFLKTWKIQKKLWRKKKYKFYGISDFIVWLYTWENLCEIREMKKIIFYWDLSGNENSGYGTGLL